MKLKTIITSLICLLLIAACSPKELSPDLLQIESAIENNPDSCLTILEDMYPPKGMNNYNKAFYYVMLTEARYKKEISLLESDSLLNVALNNIPREDNELKAKVWLLKGRVWGEANEYTEAVKCYHKALDLADGDNDNGLIGKIYNDLGQIYEDLDLDEKAMQMYEKGYIQDSIVGNKEGMINLLFQKSMLQCYLKNYKESFNELDKILLLSKDTKKSHKHISNVYQYYSIIYQEMDSLDKALETISKSISYYPLHENDYSRFLIKGSIFNAKNQIDSARYYLLKSKECDYIYTKTSVYNELHKLEKLSGNFEEALNYLTIYDEKVDSIIQETTNKEIRTLAFKYNVEKTTILLQNKHHQAITILIIVFITTFLGIYIIYLTKNKRKKKKEFLHNKEILQKEKEIVSKEKEINELKLKLSTIDSDTSKYKEITNQLTIYEELLNEKKKNFHKLLKKTTDIEYNKFIKKPIYKEITSLSNQPANNEAQLFPQKEHKRLQKEIHSCFSSFINDLKNLCPELTDDDITFCCLVILNIPSFTIGLCFGTTEDNKIKQRKYRIKKKMTENTDNEILFNFIFSIKKLNNDIG